jgi:DNA-binding transcriptional LysR family regulator
MDTRHIRAAVVVGRAGSFTAAARELFMAQSTLSRQVAALERELGGPLFVRGPRAVLPTSRGQAFLPLGQAVLDAVARAEQAARSEH